MSGVQDGDRGCSISVEVPIESIDGSKAAATLRVTGTGDAQLVALAIGDKTVVVRLEHLSAALRSIEVLQAHSYGAFPGPPPVIGRGRRGMVIP